MNMHIYPSNLGQETLLKMQSNARLLEILIDKVFVPSAFFIKHLPSSAAQDNKGLCSLNPLICFLTPQECYILI